MLDKIGNCHVGVFLAYAGTQDHTLLDWELYLIEDWTDDSIRPLPPSRSWPGLARMLDAGVPLACTNTHLLPFPADPDNWQAYMTFVPQGCDLEDPSVAWSAAAGTSRMPLGQPSRK